MTKAEFPPLGAVFSHPNGPIFAALRGVAPSRQSLAFVILLAFTAYLPNAKSVELTAAERTIVNVERSGRLSDDRLSFIPPDISLIPAGQKEGVIARLREIATHHEAVLLGTASIHPMSADLLLLRIGDKFTIERMVAAYRAYDTRASWSYVAQRFKSSRQPKVIPYLAEDFSMPDDPNGRITVSPPSESGDFAVGVPVRSIFSGVLVTELIQSSSFFSPELKTWAQQAFALRLKSPARFLELMRLWWKTNQAAFQREDYQAVVPVS